MALKVKAREREIKVGKKPGYRYVMLPELYSSLDQDKVIQEAALRSGVTEGVMRACWDGAGKVIKAWATEGHSVALPGLGTMRFGLNAKAVENVNDVKTSLIKTRKIIFTPAADLKDELKNTSVIITCYDRNGEEVKRVTSTDPGTVEDNENSENSQNAENGGSEQGAGSEQNGSGSEQGSGSGSEQSGSGDNNSQTESVAAPTINGDSPFAESTEVSLTGPDGAEIHYTTDGSDPTAQSTLYSEAFTLTEAGTVKALAIKNGVSSEIASRVFTKSSGGGGGFESGD